MGAKCKILLTYSAKSKRLTKFSLEYQRKSQYILGTLSFNCRVLQGIILPAIEFIS